MICHSSINAWHFVFSIQYVSGEKYEITNFWWRWTSINMTSNNIVALISSLIKSSWWIPDESFVILNILKRLQCQGFIKIKWNIMCTKCEALLEKYCCQVVSSLKYKCLKVWRWHTIPTSLYCPTLVQMLKAGYKMIFPDFVSI